MTQNPFESPQPEPDSPSRHWFYVHGTKRRRRRYLAGNVVVGLPLIPIMGGLLMKLLCLFLPRAAAQTIGDWADTIVLPLGRGPWLTLFMAAMVAVSSIVTRSAQPRGKRRWERTRIWNKALAPWPFRRARLAVRRRR